MARPPPTEHKRGMVVEAIAKSDLEGTPNRNDALVCSIDNEPTPRAAVKSEKAVLVPALTRPICIH